MSRYVNAEGLVRRFLADDAETKTKNGGRAYTSLPAEVGFPAQRVTRVGGTPRPGPAMLDEPILQIDSWGGTKHQAWEAAVWAQEALKNRLPGRHPEGLVYGEQAVALGALRYLPDTTYDPAKPRYVFDVTLLTRP